MDIFIIKTEDANKISEDLLKSFQKKEISNEITRKTHCFSYLMTDRILREVYKIEDREIVFKEERPALKNGGKYFSISHSGEYIVLGFSDYNCGIDIQGVNKNKNWRAISNRMKFESKSEEEFYKNWTTYEALYKLGCTSNNIYHTKIENYFLTAVSENPQEKFKLHTQKECF